MIFTVFSTTYTFNYFTSQARTLRLLISSDGTGDGVARPGGAKRRLYMLLFISLMQPLFMYFLTRHLNGVTAEVLKKAAGS